MSFLDELKKGTNIATTLNGAKTNKKSLNPCLDFFALAGAMRSRVDDAVVLFEKAYLTDRVMAIRALFYLRDVRGGQGERNLFRVCLRRLKALSVDDYSKVIKYIPEYGRWDDLIWEDAIEMVGEQIKEDEAAMKKGKEVSLLAKWLPSENASSDSSKRSARMLAKKLNLKPSQYRKKLSSLRKHIKLLEQKMSEKKWEEVNYEKVPSQALRKHVKAFRRNDEEKFEAYLEAVKNKEKKIKTSTLFTYEVFDLIKHDEETANVLWDNLPDYCEHDALVVADVSGSMCGRPISISVSLALYFAERNKGLMKGCFMTFSDQPELIEVIGKTLSQRLNMIENAAWGFSTNLEAVFDVILTSAKKSGNKEIPRVVYIISDMEFNQCVRADKTIFENAKERFEEEGLELPHVVFWNVNSLQNQVPATKFDKNVTLISGASQSTFRYAVEGKTPEQSMMDILSSERYERIKI